MVASLTDQLRDAKRQLELEKIKNQKVLMGANLPVCAICDRTMAPSEALAAGKCGCQYHSDCVEDRLTLTPSCASCGKNYERVEMKKKDQ